MTQLFFCFLFFWAITGVIFVGVIYKCECTYMNMCISEMYLLFFLGIKWLFTLCLDGLVSTLSTVGFSLHQMASFLSAATGSYECFS